MTDARARRNQNVVTARLVECPHVTDDLTIRAELREIAAWLDELTKRRAELVKRRDELVRAAVAAGVPAADIVADVRLTRMRVWQIGGSAPTPSP
jgi:hypothetical protein